MGVKYFFITLLILLIACESAIQTVPTSEYQPPVEGIQSAEDVEQTANPCEGVVCSGGQICEKGTCTCGSDKKLCNDQCIAKDGCCEHSECETGACENGACVTKECKFGEELKNGECVCTSDTKKCGEQGKCIDRKSCCIHTQCPTFNRCVPTSWRTSFCIKIGEKKLCRILADNDKDELFIVKGQEFRVQATDWLSNESIRFNFANETIHLVANEQITRVNATLFHEGIQVVGGFCKEDRE